MDSNRIVVLVLLIVVLSGGARWYGVIERMYSANWGDIVLDSERNGPGSLYISSVDNHG